LNEWEGDGGTLVLGSAEKEAKKNEMGWQDKGLNFEN
jgi:hypothetical protein